MKHRENLVKPHWPNVFLLELDCSCRMLVKGQSKLHYTNYDTPYYKPMDSLYIHNTKQHNTKPLVRISRPAVDSLIFTSPLLWEFSKLLRIAKIKFK